MLTFGNTPVPFAASWSAEDGFSVERCRYADGRPAICQSIAIGEGKPLFGKPHWIRQRQVIAQELCDLCARPLKNRTKVSLSHARFVGHAAPGSETGVLQVEPLLHRECARDSMRFCPSLRRDVAAGALMIRQVTRFAAQLSIMGPQFVRHYVPGYVARPTDRIVGHAKVELLAWIDRDEAWLAAGAAS